MNTLYQDAFREERINGETAMMAPASINHVFVSANIARIFGNCLNGKKSVPIANGALVYLTNNDHFVPDMMGDIFYRTI